MSKILMGCPIFNYQDINIRRNHEQIRRMSEHEVEYIEVVGASVEHAKQIMYKKFLEGNYDYFFNVDSDIFFLFEDRSPIDILIDCKKEVVGGIYVYKKKPCIPSHRTLDLQEYFEKNGKFPEDYKFTIPKELHEVKWLGGGCMMIKREVIEKLTRKHLVPNLPMVYRGEYLSEDFSFCQKAIEEEYKIYAEPKIKLGHLGNYLYTLEDYKDLLK